MSPNLSTACPAVSFLPAAVYTESGNSLIWNAGDFIPTDMPLQTSVARECPPAAATRIYVDKINPDKISIDRIHVGKIHVDNKFSNADLTATMAQNHERQLT